MVDKNVRKRRLSLIPPILIMAVIFALSSFGADGSNAQSGFIVNIITSVLPATSNLDILTTLVRKSAHFIEYLLLGFFTARAFSKYGKNPSLAIPVGITYSITDEVHQIFVPGRSCELTDILIDSVGIMLGTLIFLLKKRMIVK